MAGRAAATNSPDEEQRNAASQGQDPEHRPQIRLVRQVGADKAKAKQDEGDGQASQLLLVATDVTEQRAAEQARLQAAIAQREVLVREVHHRIKNNLQGVAGLLQQNAARRPEMADILSEAVGQVQAIAQVYGLQVGAAGPLDLVGVLKARD